MAHFKSQVITDIDAARPVLQNSKAYGGTLKHRTAVFSIVGATHAAGDVVELFRVGAHERPIALFLWCTALTGMTDTNIGLRPKPLPGTDTTAFTTAEDDCLVDGAALAAEQNGTQALGLGANAIQPSQHGQAAFWQLVADLASAQPVAGTEFSVVLTTVAEPTADGSFAFVLITAEGN